MKNEVIVHAQYDDERLSHLDRFATLATRLEFVGVAPISLDSHGCHTCHTINEDNGSQEQLFKKAQQKIIFEWLEIALREGHIEPSQPAVGKCVGWPRRPMSIKCVWGDFRHWVKKSRLAFASIPDEGLFQNILSQLFDRVGDLYQFPDLESCKSSYRLLREKYECS